MPDIVRSIVSCITSYQKKNTRNSAVLIAGGRPSCILLAMILWNALTAIIKWYSLNSISITSVYLSKKCTRTPCPVLVERGHLLSFFKSFFCGILLSKEAIPMDPRTERLRKKYMDDPPEGMSSEDIRHMSEDDLLDMDYFLNEDVEFDDEFGEEGFYLF